MNAQHVETNTHYVRNTDKMGFFTVAKKNVYNRVKIREIIVGLTIKKQRPSRFVAMNTNYHSQDEIYVFARTPDYVHN